MTHRCINAACARAFPRAVAFCPWCGTAQQPVAPTLVKRQDAVVPPPVAAPPPPPAPPPPAPPPRAIPAPPPPPPAPPPPPIRPAATPRPAAPARQPIRLRWWLIGLGLLWAAWMLTKPTAARIERRMASAIALAKECKPKEAQDELIALRKTKATREQLRGVQESLNAAATACTRAERRRTAWTEAEDNVERLLNASRFDQARVRLGTFTRRWGEDGKTRELQARIDAGRRDRPLADPTRGE